jgi:dipeptidyl aminopeptidase/acylaminoacyl peptidase
MGIRRQGTPEPRPSDSGPQLAHRRRRTAFSRTHPFPEYLVPDIRRPLRVARLVPILIGFALVASSARAARAGWAPSPAVTDSLTIRDLLDIATVNVADLSADGRWLALTIAQRRDNLGVDSRRTGDPTYLRAATARLVVVDTRSLAQREVFKTRKMVRTALWSPDAAKLAMLIIENESMQVVLWDRATGALTSPKLPAGQYVAENSELRWSDDGRSIAFATRLESWKVRAKARFQELTAGPVTVLDGNADFLEWDAMNRMSAERAVVSWMPGAGTVTTLRPTALLGPWTLAKDGGAITVQEDVTKKTDYDVIGGREWRLVTRAAGDTADRVIMASLKNVNLLWADDGRRFAISREGRVSIGSIADTSLRQLVGPAAAARGAAAPSAAADTSAAGRAQRAKERFSALRWSTTGDALLAQNSEGLWLVDVAAGSKELIVAASDSDTTQPRVQPIGWSQDGRYLYFSETSRTTWDRAITRYDRQTRQKANLVRGARFYTGVRLSKDGSTTALMIADGNRLGDVYVADAQLGAQRRVLESNPQLAQKPLARTELIKYLDADGTSRNGVVYRPSTGAKLPTVFLIYEDFFDDTWDAVANLLAANGYAVVKPSVGFEIGHPGEAWEKGVLAAANEVIRLGIADSARLGVHGTSYGGYATNLLITYTDRFKAAINMSGKVDIISFYTDSPRLGVRNIHAAEKSQDRIGATLWQQPQKYVEHSAIMFADRIKTPLLLMTGGEDYNVPALNTREMYYALRRLGKTVVWANYTNGGHGVPNTTEADFIDYHQRVLDWYAKYLKPANAPAPNTVRP